MNSRLETDLDALDEPALVAARDPGNAALDAVSAVFSAADRRLTVVADNLDNVVNVGRNAAGTLFVNGGAVPISGGTPTVANTSQIQLFGQGGNDTLQLDETNGALPAALLFGSTGNDTLIGGNGADQLFGQDDNDTLLGKAGADQLFGGNGNDTLTGGSGNDALFGDAGNDRFVWNAGDGSDSADGGADFDLLEFNAGSTADVLTIVANGAGVRIDRVSPVAAHVDVTAIEGITIRAAGGDDTVTAGNGLAALTSLTLDGGTGNDTITGGDGADMLIGGEGNDQVTGGRGNDVGLLGNGNDTFSWNPGDGSDTLEGQGGTDALQFSGANISENFSIDANGGRVRLLRDVAAISMDMNDIEQIRLKLLGGLDNVTVGDLSGTDMREIRADLAGPVDPAAGDGQADTVTINGSSGDDTITLSLQNGEIVVSGLTARVVIAHADAIDTIRIQGLSGDDVVDASALGAAGPQIVIDGGAGNDIVLGGPAAETLLGNADDDVLLGGAGADAIDAGAGENVVLPDEGIAQLASAVLTLSGNTSSNGITVSRDAAGHILATVPVTGTPTVANTSLIRVFGLAGDDVITLSETLGALPAAALYGGAGLDKLTGGSGADQLYGGAGNDQLSGKGGADLMFGGAGNDLLTGGAGDDRMFGESGDDQFVWNPGDGSDSVDGGSGADTLQVNAGNGTENFTLFANGAAVRLDRVDPAPFHIDAAGTETLLLNLNGGDDTLTAGNGLSTLIALTVDGGSGNDTITGGDGADRRRQRQRHDHRRRRRRHPARRRRQRHRHRRARQ